MVCGLHHTLNRTIMIDNYEIIDHTVHKYVGCVIMN